MQVRPAEVTLFELALMSRVFVGQVVVERRFDACYVSYGCYAFEISDDDAWHQLLR